MQINQKSNKNYPNDNLINWNQQLINSSISGDLNTIKITLQNGADINFQEDSPLRLATSHGHLDIVQYLLTSTDLHKHANIHSINNRDLIHAAHNGHLNVIQYLLTSPDLKEHADPHLVNNKAIICATYNGHLPIIQYLLNTPKLKEHSDIHAFDNSAIIWAAKFGYIHIIQYLFKNGFLNMHDLNKIDKNIYHPNLSIWLENYKISQNEQKLLNEIQYTQKINALKIL